MFFWDAFKVAWEGVGCSEGFSVGLGGVDLGWGFEGGAFGLDFVGWELMEGFKGGGMGSTAFMGRFGISGATAFKLASGVTTGVVREDSPLVEEWLCKSSDSEGTFTPKELENLCIVMSQGFSNKSTDALGQSCIMTSD